MDTIKFKLTIAYDGASYEGWQVQKGGTGVQEKVEEAIAKLFGEHIRIHSSSRTDTGVHASDYYAHFDSDHPMDVHQLRYKLNVMLPSDIAIHAVFETTQEAHARFSATSRSYEYHIHTHKNPFKIDTSWYFNVQLDLSKIQAACKVIAAHTDFECFSKVHTDVSNFNCTIHHIDWIAVENGFVFQISANRFLRNMVRAITGTLLDVGTGKITIHDLEEILASKNRSKAGISVPAQGLTLTHIEYPAGLIPDSALKSL